MNDMNQGNTPEQEKNIPNGGSAPEQGTPAPGETQKTEDPGAGYPGAGWSTQEPRGGAAGTQNQNASGQTQGETGGWTYGGQSQQNGQQPPQNGAPYGQHQPPHYGSYSSGPWQQTPPNNGGYQQPPCGGWNNGPYSNQYHQQQYGPAQQPQQPENDPYKWDFQDYEHAAKARKPHKKSKGLMIFGALFCAVLAVGLITFGGYSIYSSLRPASPSAEAPVSSAAEENIPGLNIQDRPEEPNENLTVADGPYTTRQIAKKVRPSVVGIRTFISANGFTPSGEGSGIIMTEDGYILTNAHVVNGATGVTVVLDNDETYNASVIGMDSKTDLAVIKIEASNLTYAEFGNSDQLELGEDVVAIGNPGGLQLAGSVTKGVISGLNRNVSNDSYSIPYIQTDAAINPGNSGGALVNEYGQVVGINSAKLADVDVEGIGFAIPINDAIPIVKDLIANGRVTGRAQLGLSGQMVDEATAFRTGLPMGFGVVSVVPDSDLARKNVVPGDIITKIDGNPVNQFRVITDVVASKKPGDTVRLTVYRRNNSRAGGKSYEVTITLMEDTGKR